MIQESGKTVRRVFLATIVCSLLACCMANHMAWAQDSVTIKTGREGRGRLRLSGEIVELTGRQLTLRRSGRDDTIPTDRVVAWDTKLVDAQVAADREFEQHDFAAALAKYDEAIRLEKRSWLQRWILSRIAICHANQGNLVRAADMFLIVYSNDPTTQYLDALPLIWTSAEPNLPAQRRAEEWLKQRDAPVRQLLAGSWLLSGGQRGAAMEVLRQVALAQDPQLAKLAELQLWRAQAATASREEIAAWQASIEELPEALAAGPYYVLGKAWLQQRDLERAALAFLRVPILFPFHHQLAAEAPVSAAQAIEPPDAAGAQTLYREAVRDYPEATITAIARAKLQP